MISIKTKARIAWEDDLDVVVTGIPINNVRDTYKGRISVYSSDRMTITCNVPGESWGHVVMFYEEVTDFCFTGEGKVAEQKEFRCWGCGQYGRCSYFPCVSVRECPHYREKSSPSEVEKWEVCEYYKMTSVKDNEGNVLFDSNKATIAQAKLAAAAPELRDKLKMVRSKPFYGGSGTLDMSTEEINEIIALLETVDE